jgi:hypothetical protein
MVVHVELGDRQVVGVLVGDLGQDRRDSAQKSTTTGLSDPITVSSKEWEDRLTMPAAMVESFRGARPA